MTGRVGLTTKSSGRGLGRLSGALPEVGLQRPAAWRLKAGSLLITTGCLAFCSTGAAQAEEETGHPAGNFFSQPPEAGDAVPSFIQGPPAKQAMKTALGADIPGWEQIRMLPSLSPRQRQEIRRIYEDARQEVKPLADELRSLKDEVRGSSGEPLRQPTQDFTNNLRAAREDGSYAPGEATATVRKLSADPERRERAHRLQEQLRIRRLASWEQVKSILSQQQLQEFEEMRKGQLLMPGVNRP